MFMFNIPPPIPTSLSEIGEFHAEIMHYSNSRKQNEMGSTKLGWGCNLMPSIENGV